MEKEPRYQVLCFGDSNTFGTCPTGGRHSRWTRWPGRLQQLLGDDYYVIEEGCGGRTTVFEDTLELNKNGRNYLPMLLATHKPLDLVIIMLGTNDLKHRFSALPCDIAAGAGELIQLTQLYPYGPAYPTPKVLLISPILLGEDVENSIYTGFTSESYQKSKSLAPLFRAQAEKHACAFLDASLYAVPSREDMLHMDAESHASLAKAVADAVRNILEG